MTITANELDRRTTPAALLHPDRRSPHVRAELRMDDGLVLVVHTSEQANPDDDDDVTWNDTDTLARRLVSYMTTPGDRLRPSGAGMYGAGYHEVIGATTSYVAARPEWMPYGAAGMNRYGRHVCFPGKAARPRAEWDTAEELRQTDVFVDRLVALVVDEGLELRYLTAAELRAGKRNGVTTHNEVRLAFGQTTHTDPGAGFPMVAALDLARRRLAEWQSGHGAGPADNGGGVGGAGGAGDGAGPTNVDPPVSPAEPAPAVNGTDWQQIAAIDAHLRAVPYPGRMFKAGTVAIPADAIRAVQWRLVVLGYGAGTPFTATGSFDQLTTWFVTEFQRDRQLTVDGIVGPQTWTALHEGWQ